MADNHQDLRLVFAGLLTSQLPSDAQVEAARVRLRGAIADDRTPVRRARHRWVVRMAAAVALLVAISAAVVALWEEPTAADVYLVEIAEATRVLPAEELPEGLYVYTETDSLVTGFEQVDIDGEIAAVAFLSPRRTQMWLQGDYRLLRETVGTPIFFDPEEEAGYYQAGLDERDGVGETVDYPLEGELYEPDPAAWSTDPEELKAQLLVGAESSQAAEPLDVRIIGEAEDIMAPHVMAPPQLRAAIIEVLATLDVETTKAADGSVSASVTYDDEYYGTTVRTWTFDAAGYLIRLQAHTVTGFVDGAIPAGTTYLDIGWSRPVVASEVGVVPAQ